MRFLLMFLLCLSGVSATADPVMSPAGSAVGVFGTSKGGEARIEPGRGALAYTIQFELPKARGLAQPSLSLTYHSGEGDADAGYGWGLDLPVISVAPLSGWVGRPVNGAATEMRFAADGAPLVPICTTGEQTEADVPRCADKSIAMPSWATPSAKRGWVLYLRQTDTGSARYFHSPDRRTWRVQHKGGLLQDFGQPITAPGLEGGAVEERDGVPVRWRLVRQIESARPANLIVYRWRAFGTRGLLYLTDIWDTPRASEALDLERFAHHTELDWSDLPFATSAYASVERAAPDRRLARVAVASADWSGNDTRQVTRVYRLAYYNSRGFPYDAATQAPLFHHTFLREIQEEGRCQWRETGAGQIPARTECYMLPPITFRYQGATLGGIAVLTKLHGGPPHLDTNFAVLPYLNSASIVDFNRDGLPDVVQSWEAETQCFNKPGNVRVVVTQENDTPNPTLVCYKKGGAKEIRSARPITGWLNTSSASFSHSFSHQCMDAGDGTPGTVPWFVRQTLPGGPRLASFLAAQGAATLLGNYGDGALLWGAGDAGYRPFRAVPAPVDPRFCPTAATSPGWAWKVGTRDGVAWPKNTGGITVEDAVSGPRWFVDVDGDGLADSLGTGSGPRINAFLRGTTPFYTRQFGAVSGSKPAQVPFASLGDPVSVVPDKDAPSGTRYFYTDVNGDGLVDLAYFRPSGPLVIRPGDGHGRFACDPARDPLGCNGDEIEATADVPPWTPLNAPEWDSGEERYLHDVNGDGLADIVTFKDDPGNLPFSGIVRVWMNVDGHSFRCVDPTTARPCIAGRVVDDLHGSTVIGPHRIEFADMDGDGSDDMVVLAHQGIMILRLAAPVYETDSAHAERASLLVQVDNGVGAKTDIHYETLQRLMADATDIGQAWVHKVPAVANIVTGVRTHNQPTPNTTLPQPYQFERQTRYQYRDPAYDPWTRTFLGFRQVDVRTGSESVVSRTTYWYGPCQQESIVDACVNGSDNEPDKSLVGLPVRIDRLIPEVGGQRRALWLASTELYYQDRIIFNGRRDVRRAELVASESYEYDPDQPVTMRAPAPSGQGSAGDKIIHSPVQGVRAPITVDYTLDALGNITRVREQGRQVDGVDSALSGASSRDDVVVTWLGSEIGGDLPGPYRCETEHFRCFVDRLTVTSDQNADHGFMTLRKFRFGYSAQGDLARVDGWLNADFPQLARKRQGGGPVAPLPPGAATGPGWKRLTTYATDPVYGGTVLTERPGSPSACTTIDYDAPFRQYPQIVKRHTAGCSSTSLDTHLQFDRSFDVVSQRDEPSGAVTRLEYDPFGRPATLLRPNPNDPDPRAVVPTLSVYYTDRAPLSYVEIRRHLGATNPTFIVVTNGLGEHPLSFVQDDGRWLVEGWRETNTAGQVTRTYPTLVAAGSDPRPGLLSASTPAGTGGAHRIDFFPDQFGRLGLLSENGTRDVASFRYRPFEIEFRNAAQLLPNASGYSILRNDGKNRPAEWVEDQGDGKHINTTFHYALTGELTTVRRGSESGTILAKDRQFDSLGRIVAQAEPNSGRWVYAWDDGGRLIGTSDARGCGVNFHYDGLDRLVGEDYSPCTAEHEPYTPANPATGTGFETRYVYDVYEPGQAAPDPLFLDSPDLAAGKLVATRDRAAETRFSYDIRGRVRRIDRRIALPGATLAYAPTRYSSRLDYDLGDRLVRRTTGAPSGPLSPAGASEFTFSHTLRDQVKRIAGSFGTIVSDVTYEQDGLLSQLAYGDLASTKGSFTYNPSRRLESYTLGRAAPKAWSVALPGYTLPGPDTTQTDLQRLVYTYNPLGDPVRIDDLSEAAWPASNAPQRRRDIGYDAAGQLQSVDTTYSTVSGNAPWESPFTAEAPVTPDPLAPALPLVETAQRPRAESFGYDALGTLIAANSDVAIPFDHSLDAIALGTPSNGPQRFIAATGVKTAYDAAGNLVRLTLDRTGNCPGGRNAACDQLFAFEWDEVGQLARARRWDLGNNAPRPAAITDLPAGAPTFERINRFSAGRRIWTGLKADDSPAVFNLDVFPTYRLDGASVAGGDFLASPERQRVRLPGLATVVFDRTGRLPRRNVTDRIHTFLHLPDALGSHAITIDRATGEVAERSSWTPFGATENDFRPARWAAFRAGDRFTGNQDDPELGIVNFGARFLSPYLMRFISPDPRVEHGTVANANSYGYGRGRPFSRNDLVGTVTSCGDGCYSFEPDYIVGSRERAEAAAARGNARAEVATQARVNAESLLLGTAHIPVPFTEKAYFTPNGVRKEIVNAGIAILANAADPLHYHTLIQMLTGKDLLKSLMLNVGEDKNDKSQIVGTGLILVSSIAAGGAGGAGAGEAAITAEDAELFALARSVRNAEPNFFARIFRTIAVATTREGPRIVGGGATDLSAVQVARARELGLTVVPPQPGMHAEGTLIFGAGELGLTPLRGVVTSRICPGCASLIIDDLPGVAVAGGRTFTFPWNGQR